MKKINEFSVAEWLRLEPIKFLIKEIRNDCILFIYLKKKTPDLDSFIEKNQDLTKKRLLIIIAFEQVKVLEWLFQLANINLKDIDLIVFDNSRNLCKRKLIEACCEKYQIRYLSLPYNYTKHPNRSHGMAMTWVFKNVIKKLKPTLFGYLDHDMLPVKPINRNLFDRNKSCFGVLNEGRDCWNLWAGYSFFRFSDVEKLPLNFLYDFSVGVDTGGRNWRCFYKNLAYSNFEYTNNRAISIRLNNGFEGVVQLIDSSWIHIGGISYNDNLAPKEVFYEQFVHELLSGHSIDSLYKIGN